MKSKLPRYENLIYYSINSLIRKDTIFDINAFTLKINTNMRVSPSTGNSLYQNLCQPYYYNFTGGSIFELGEHVAKYGSNVSYGNPVFLLSGSISNGTYDITYGNKSETVSITNKTGNYFFINISGENRITPKWKIGSTGKTILSQNQTTNVNYVSNTYKKLHLMFTSYSSYNNLFLSLGGNGITYSSPPNSILHDVLPTFKTVGDNYLDIHNFIVQASFLEGYYSGLSQMIKKEIIMNNIINIKPFTYVDDDVEFNPDLSLISDNYDFNNFLIFMYQKSLYLREKYKKMFEKYNFFWNLGVYDAMNNKTNYMFIEDGLYNKNFYKNLQHSEEITGGTYLLELMSFEAFNRYVIPNLISFSSTQTPNDINPTKIVATFNNMLSGISNKNHFTYFCDYEHDNIEKVYDLRNFNYLYGEKGNNTMVKDKYHILNTTTNILKYNTENNTIDDENNILFIYFSQKLNFFDNEYLKLNYDEHNIVKILYYRNINSTTWKNNITANYNDSILSSSFTQSGGFIDYITSKSDTYSLPYNFTSKLKLYILFQLYINEISEKHIEKVKPHYQDIYGISDLFNGYIINMTENENSIPTISPTNIDFLMKFKNYFSLPVSNKAVTMACGFIIKCCNFNDNTFQIETDNLKDMINYTALEISSKNHKQIRSIVSDNMNKIISNLIIEE